MKDNKITVIFDKEDADKFQEISKRSKWSDKFITTMAVKQYHSKFTSNWKKAVIEALEEENK